MPQLIDYCEQKMLQPYVEKGCYSTIYKTNLHKTIKYKNLSQKSKSIWLKKVSQFNSIEIEAARQIHQFWRQYNLKSLTRSLSQYSKSKNFFVEKVFSKPPTNSKINNICAQRSIFIDRKYKIPLQSKLEVLNTIQTISNHKQKIKQLLSKKKKQPLVQRLKKIVSLNYLHSKNIPNNQFILTNKNKLRKKKHS